MTNTANANSPLLETLEIGDLKLKNRMIMAPLTRNRAGDGNVPQDINKLYYTQRATAGLIISEASQISPYAQGYPSTPGIHSTSQVAGWQAITKSVHNQGGLMFIQLWHVGRISHPSLLPNNAQPVAPSAIQPKGEAVTYDGMQAFVTPHALTTDEIQDIIADYVSAAKNANAAGFDGIEIHAANGYLIDEFLRDGSNTRTDDYGGSLENRMRLLDEVITAVKEVWPPSRIGVRLSPENQFNDIRDSQPQTTFTAVVGMLNKHDLAYLHVLEGDMLGSERKVDYAELRKSFTGFYMANNGYTKTTAEESLNSGNADMIAFGQLFLANPDLVERFAQNSDLNEPDQSTFYGGDEKGYTDYPALQQDKISA